MFEIRETEVNFLIYQYLNENGITMCNLGYRVTAETFTMEAHISASMTMGRELSP